MLDELEQLPDDVALIESDAPDTPPT